MPRYEILNQNNNKLLNLMEFSGQEYEVGVNNPNVEDPYKIELMASDFDEPLQAAATVEVTADNFIQMKAVPLKYCLVCNKSSQSTEREFLNIRDSYSFTKFSKKTIQFTVESLLNVEIMIDDAICGTCCDLLNNWDYHLCEVKKIQSNLLHWYKEACIQRTSKTQVFDDVEVLDERENVSSESRNDPDYKPYFYFRTKQMKRRNMLKIKAMLADCQSDSEAHSAEEKANYNNVKKETSEKENKSSNILLSNTKREKLDDEAMFCGFCNLSCNTTEEYKKHKDGHYCKICNLFVKRPSQIKSHLQMVHDVRDIGALNVKFSCHICSKKYSSRSGLYNHKKTAHSKKQYPCHVCSKSFMHQSILQAHMVRHDAKRVRCDKCEASFYLNGELAKHVNQVHNKVKPYRCQICNKNFCQRSVLNHHLSQHVQTKEIKCHRAIVQPKESPHLATTAINKTPDAVPTLMPDTPPSSAIPSSPLVKTKVEDFEISVSPIKLNFGAWQLLNSSIDMNICQNEIPVPIDQPYKTVSPLFGTDQMQDVESVMSLLNGSETNPADFDASLMESILSSDYLFVST